MKNKQKRMEELATLLNKYGYHYYVLDEPIVADKQYDELYDELRRLEEETGTVLKDSPTRKVGGDPIKEFEPHVHLRRLYSLDKCNSYDELRAWDEKIKKFDEKAVYTLEYKLDGLTLALTYEDGYFVGAATRGNGEIGENVTAQVETIKSVPLSIPYKGRVEVQGEGIMRLSALEKYNETASEPLKNARNGVAGAIRNLDPKVTASRNLDIIFYNVNYIEGKEISSQTDCIEFLKENGFKTEKLFVTDSMEKILSEIERVDRSRLDFLIDGMVVKVNDFKSRAAMGYTDKFPRWAMAYKFEAEETTTILRDVVWNVGRTGKLTPLAILQPVELCGATIRKATLNNYDDILRKKVTVGSRVFIRRSNDVIPEILGVAEDNGGDKINPPLTCPACGAPVYRDGVHVFCPNEHDCPPQIIGRLEHYADKECMDIRGVSGKIIGQLHAVLGVSNFSDLYSLDEEKLSRLDGFKDKKISNFLASVRKSISAPLDRFINALGIDGIGKKSARDLAERFGSIDALMAADRDTLTLIDDVGEILAENIVAYFAKHADEIARLKAIGIDPKTTKNTGGVLSGKKFVLTGTLTSFTRSKATELIEGAGGVVSGSVTRDTDYVLAGESAGSKLEKAKKLNVKIIDEKEFVSMLNS